MGGAILHIIHTVVSPHSSWRPWQRADIVTNGSFARRHRRTRSEDGCACKRHVWLRPRRYRRPPWLLPAAPERATRPPSVTVTRGPWTAKLSLAAPQPVCVGILVWPAARLPCNRPGDSGHRSKSPFAHGGQTTFDTHLLTTLTPIPTTTPSLPRRVAGHIRQRCVAGRTGKVP